MDAAQFRAARGLLNWSQSDLVEHSGVSKKTIADFERGSTKPYGRTLTAIIAAFEANPGRGAVAVDGVMYDRPHLVRARHLLDQVSGT